MSGYEMVVGLETHVELRTRTKIFCACPNRYGAEPNALVCPVCMGLPGALPSFNREALRLAAAAGLVTHCRVNLFSRFDRKNYFYPDLPKAYQITQFERPLCQDGWLDVETASGLKRVRIARIHMEEDAGKLKHEGADGTAVDMNRCGVPLIEIVSEPDIRSAEEASAYLRLLRALMIRAGVGDCRMNEGGLRCDVNLSVRKPGEPPGERAEIKNLNSFQSVERAVAAEYARQVAALERGERIARETRRFDQRTGQTCAMRRKEGSADYRYFPEPDLPEIALDARELEAIRAALPEMPDERRARFMREYGLSPWLAGQLASEGWLGDYFERAARAAVNPEAAANLIVGEAFALMAKRDAIRDGERREADLPVKPERLAALCDMLLHGDVNSSTGKRILAAMFEADTDPMAYALANDLLSVRDESALREAAERAIQAEPGLAASYRAGKKGAAKALMGRAMGALGGRADPERLWSLIVGALEREG